MATPFLPPLSTIRLRSKRFRRERFDRITEVDAGLAAPSDAAVANEIVRITVTQGHAMVEVLDQVPLV